MNAALPQQMDELPKRDVGAVLRAAREAAGMTVLDVSRQLNLGESTVEALESGNMDALPPAAFVRGYLRSYGKLLDLDPEKLVDLLDHSGVSDPEIAPVTVLSAQRASGDPLMRWMSVAVFFVLAVMVVIWWQTKNGVEETRTAQTQAPPAEPATSREMLAVQQASSQVELSPPAEPATTPGEGPPATEIVVDPQPEEPMASVTVEPPLTPPLAGEAAPDTAPDTVSEPADEPLPEPVMAVDAAPVEETITVEPPPLAAQTEGADGEPPAPVAEMPAVAAAESPAPLPDVDVVPVDEFDAAPESAALLEGDEVVLLIDGSSWMEIRDAQDRQLYYGLYDSPAPLRLTGELPFVLFLGNSPAVTILFNGETYDQTAFNRANNTARFALDTAGLRRP